MPRAPRSTLPLPTEIEDWPPPRGALPDTLPPGAAELSLQELRGQTRLERWTPPARLIFFLTDLHADPDALWLSLAACGAIERVAARDTEQRLTARGREALYIIGGDCFDKGPENLRLLRCIQHLLDLGADITLLAGNHDLRVYLGLTYAGRRETELQHLFVRMGGKTMPLFRELLDGARRAGKPLRPLLGDAEVRRRLFPSPEWYVEFETARRGRSQPGHPGDEARRIREKTGELERACAALGASLGEVHAALGEARRLLIEPRGELTWYFERLVLARHEGSLLFVHAGVDDSLSRALARGGAAALNASYRHAFATDTLGLYEGPLGNAFRTKYRARDYPFTERGGSDLHAAGVHGIVHGHRNLREGQRLTLRNGVLNFECDASVDRNTRALEGLPGPGAAAVIFEPSGLIHAISTDHRYIKTFDPARLLSDEPRSTRAAREGVSGAPAPAPRPMRPREGIRENLRFLIIEVEKQLRRTKDFLAQPTTALLAKVAEADDYVDNLKTAIQTKAFAAAMEAGQRGRETAAMLRTYEVVASNLERIADFCEKVMVQVGYVESPELYARYDFRDALGEVMTGVGLIERAVFERDVQVALGICRVEHTLDALYTSALERILGELATTRGLNARSLVALLFVAHYMERMGDALLNIGEAVLSEQLGERIKIGRLRALEDSLDLTPGPRSHLGHLSLEPVAETRSGARVSSVATASPVAIDTRSSPRLMIFKEGKTKKLVEERDSIRRWEQLMPGLAPRIYSFHDSGDDGAILFEYLPGSTYESVLLEKPWPELVLALDHIQDQLLEVWERTRAEAPVAPRFLQQLCARLPDVLAVHPEFHDSDARIGAQHIPCFTSLIERLDALDAALSAPFSVLIHGDFNTDNVIYDANKGAVRFIDLHRSCMMDYVQDVSVFLVSHFRLQFLDAEARRRINGATLRFFEFAERAARRFGDASFHERLALGVARSFATSTRFVLDPRLARAMFLRSRYLLERIAEAHAAGRAAELTLPREVLID